MFYYKITKATSAVPKVTSTELLEVERRRKAADRVANLIASGYYSPVTCEKISQADYIRATRPGE